MKTRLGIIIGFIFVLLAGCNSKVDLPSQGLFFINNGHPIEIQKNISNNNQLIEDHSPTLFLKYWVPNPNEIIVQNKATNQNIPYEVKTQDELTLKISFNKNLDDGNYCLIIGDKTKTLRDLDRWCFNIGDLQSIKIEEKKNADFVEKVKKINVPSIGMFIVDDNLTLSESLLMKNDMKSISEIIDANKKPTFAFKSSNISPDNLRLVKLHPLFGGVRINFNNEESLSPCKVENNSFQSFTILNIDDQTFSDCYGVQSYLEQKNPLDTFKISVQKGTQEITNEYVLDYYSAGYQSLTIIPFSSEMGNGFAVLTLTQDIGPGVYCFRLEDDEFFGFKGGYCFRYHK
jgi:hypothetical protein